MNLQLESRLVEEIELTALQQVSQYRSCHLLRTISGTLIDQLSAATGIVRTTYSGSLDIHYTYTYMYVTK